MLLEVMDGRLIGTIPLKTAPMNQGKLCIKGWNAHAFVHSPERLTTPLLRRNGKLEEASWEEALDFSVTPERHQGPAWRGQYRLLRVGPMHQ